MLGRHYLKRYRLHPFHNQETINLNRGKNGGTSVTSQTFDEYGAVDPLPLC
jgi:hypothetical protein